MIILTECIENNIRIYNKINNLEIEKYIKFKHYFFNITNEEISKLNKILCHSQKICAASHSGFSKMASKFENIELYQLPV